MPLRLDLPLLVYGFAILLFVTSVDAVAGIGKAQSSGVAEQLDSLGKSADLNTTAMSLRVQYVETLLKHDAAVFAWQLWASEVLMWVVISIVAAGLLFSGYQL